MPRDNFDQLVFDSDAVQSETRKFIRAVFPKGANDSAITELSLFIERIIMYSVTAPVNHNKKPGARNWKEGWTYTAKDFMRRTDVKEVTERTTSQLKLLGANSKAQNSLKELAQTTVLVACLLRAGIAPQKFF